MTTTVEIPVRWGDLDALRHVNNVVYFRWSEIGVRHALNMNNHDSIPWLSHECCYRSQITYPDTIECITGIHHIHQHSYQLYHKIVSQQKNKLCAVVISTINGELCENDEIVLRLKPSLSDDEKRRLTFSSVCTPLSPSHYDCTIVIDVRYNDITCHGIVSHLELIAWTMEARIQFHMFCLGRAMDMLEDDEECGEFKRVIGGLQVCYSANDMPTFPDQISIRTVCAKVGESSFIARHEMRSNNLQRTIATAESRYVAVTTNLTEPQSIPLPYRRALLSLL